MFIHALKKYLTKKAALGHQTQLLFSSSYPLTAHTHRAYKLLQLDCSPSPRKESEQGEKSVRAIG